MTEEPRQRIERVGRRRARLTPAPGTAAEPVPADEASEDEGPAASAPNDERMLRDVPPHY